MQLSSIELQNFQGIKKNKVIFDGNDAAILGDNATGKTTIFNAYTWVMFGTASNGAKNFSPKTKNATGEEHNLEHSAIVNLIDDDGQHISLQKTFKEIYKKRRGSASAEFSGHTIDYFIDGVPVKESQFEEYIESIIDHEKLKMITMPDYFADEMPWDRRRRVLIDICGDVTDEDVFSKNNELTELTNLLEGRHSVDDLKRIMSAKKTTVNKQLNELPGRIDEATLAKPDITAIGFNITEAGRELKRLNDEKGRLAQEKADALNTDNEAAIIQTDIANLTAEIARQRALFIDSQSSKNNAAFKAIDEQRRLKTYDRKTISSMDIELAKFDSDIKCLERERASLLDEFNRQKAITWNEDDVVCPACGRRLSEEEIENAFAEFNLKKSNRLAEINKKGKKCSLEKINELKERQQSMKKDAEKLKDSLDRYDIRITEIEESLDRSTFESTEEFCSLQGSLEKLSAQRSCGKKATEIKANYDKQISALDNKILEIEEARALLRLAKIQKERIADLEAEEKRLAKEYEETEKALYLCELFIKTKVGMVTENINSRFETVKFKLFDSLINGGIKETCDVMIPSGNGSMVPFGLANNAARINAGLDIINVLTRYFGVTMPVFVDNAESVTNLNKIGSQTIKLIVSEEDKTLRTEVSKIG